MKTIKEPLLRNLSIDESWWAFEGGDHSLELFQSIHEKTFSYENSDNIISDLKSDLGSLEDELENLESEKEDIAFEFTRLQRRVEALNEHPENWILQENKEEDVDLYHFDFKNVDGVASTSYVLAFVKTPDRQPDSFPYEVTYTVGNYESDTVRVDATSSRSAVNNSLSTLIQCMMEIYSDDNL